MLYYIPLIKGSVYGRNFIKNPDIPGYFKISGPYPEHEKSADLLHECKIQRSNQVWCADIAYTAVAGRRAFVSGIFERFCPKAL